MSVNKVIIIGRLGAEPESRAFPNGGSVCNLRIATSESWKDKQTGERKERTEWHRVNLSNKLGEVAQQYLHKGSQVYIEGSIVTRKWQDQNGEDKYSTEIRGREMTMLDSKSDNQSPQQQAQSASPQAGASYGEKTDIPQQGGGDYLDDDIPFNCHMKNTII